MQSTFAAYILGQDGEVIMPFGRADVKSMSQEPEQNGLVHKQLRPHDQIYHS